MGERELRINSDELRTDLDVLLCFQTVNVTKIQPQVSRLALRSREL